MFSQTMSHNVLGICEVPLCGIWASVSEPHILLLDEGDRPERALASESASKGQNNILIFSS